MELTHTKMGIHPSTHRRNTMIEIETMLEETMIIWTIIGSVFLAVTGYYIARVGNKALKCLNKYLERKGQ